MPYLQLGFRLVALEMARVLQNRLGVQHWPMVKLAVNPFADQSMTLDPLSDPAFHMLVDRTKSRYCVHAIYIGPKGEECWTGVDLDIYPKDLEDEVDAFSQRIAIPAMDVMAKALWCPEAEWCAWVD